MTISKIIRYAISAMALGAVAAAGAAPAHAQRAHVGFAYGPTKFGQHPIAYVDNLSPVGSARNDTALGFKTMWAGVFDVSSPTSTIVWTRVRASDATTANATSTRMAGLRPHVVTGVRPHISHDFCSGSTGGARFHDQTNYNGNCIEFTGHGGPVGLAGLPYPAFPGSNTYVDHSLSFSTVGSAATGTLTCQGASPTFVSYQQWPFLDGSGGGGSPTVCNGHNGWIYSITIN